MTNKQKLDAILSLLTDKNVGMLEKKGEIQGDAEVFGAMVFAGHAFREVAKIIEGAK